MEAAVGTFVTYAAHVDVWAVECGVVWLSCVCGSSPRVAVALWPCYVSSIVYSYLRIVYLHGGRRPVEAARHSQIAYEKPTRGSRESWLAAAGGAPRAATKAYISRQLEPSAYGSGAALRGIK